MTYPRHVRAVLYHDIADNPDPLVAPLKISTPVAVFESHLEYYAKHYDVIDLDTLLSGRFPKRPLLISFDDCYRSIAITAAPMLARRHLPATFFVTSECLSQRFIPLDNLLCYVYQQGALEAIARLARRKDCMGESVTSLISVLPTCLDLASARKLRERIVRELDVDEPSLVASSRSFLRPDELRKLPESGIEIGCHTRTHTFCRWLRTASDVHAEITESRDCLSSLLDRPIRAFSVPYGSRLDLPPSVAAALRELGFRAIFLVESRMNFVRRQRDVWSRVSMSTHGTGTFPKRIEAFPLMRSCVDLLRGRTLVVD